MGSSSSNLVANVANAFIPTRHRILVLAGDITPMDIISHLPVFAEEASIPYIFVASKEELGHASATKRPTSCVLICPDAKVKRKTKEGEDTKEEEKEFKSLYAECLPEVKELVCALSL
jgi:H/ACA ribonucleoprotein complex subunit 2